MSAGRAFPRRELASLPLNLWLVGQEVSLTQRRGRYTPASIRHPGKMLPELARILIREYTRPGDWILDPLSGIGTTGVEAIHLGRHYVGIELEPQWAALQRQNLELAREQGAAGRFAVLEADARRLSRASEGLRRDLTEAGRINAVITSPPYGDRLRSVRTPSRPMLRLIAERKIGRDVIPATYGTGGDNLGNLSDPEYLVAMRKVYTGCYAVLKPGGLLIVVLRPGRNRSRLRPLHHETARLCVRLGFEFLDERVAVLARVVAVPGREPQVYAHSLFFKRLAIAHLREAGHPVSLEQLEYVLVFRKPDLLPPTADRGQPKNGLSAALEEPAVRRARKVHLVPSTATAAQTQATATRRGTQILCRV